ncbi:MULTISPECIES: ABC transporter ATP-binding protein [unclassified Achromobacter]|uniref:ABC transporter ATP-binding protein n=1 Tax=unclassified Achromobacter TaxID=2626865 RepID=UPI000B517752|nr:MULTISPECIES: ABC transporter ATP-binding protein [unclassified Achromobacter]OWT74960.1 ABC transporter ATP-binding protein [Achromobacter sp. HZ28]OWT76568.1 ABC transporter ATP-binding protein [Achromobacter sp. HZ34]
MSSEIAIHANNISKCYHVYHKPNERLKQLVLPRLRGMMGRPTKNYFSEFWALNDVSLDIRKGETVGIVGRNGSGKSTLLQIICGTLNPTGGDLLARGRIAALLELGSGFNPEFTGRENVYMNGALLGMSTKEIDARYQDIIQFADIGDFVDQPVKTYSSGMVVRLAFAVAINADPEILVVDEALSVGDELFQRKCFARIEAIKETGATILFVSHSGGTVVELCDRAILMDRGEKLADGAPKHIVALYQKLLYASEESRAEVRAGIKAGTLAATTSKTVETSAPALTIEAPASASASASVSVPAAESVPAPKSAAAPESQSEAFLDPGLVPSSTVIYDSQGAEIFDPHIETVNGVWVNNLVRGEVYHYCYRVLFSVASEGVRFGMLIKTITGVELGGAASAGPTHIDRGFLPGDTIDVHIAFRCALNPGTFFCNAGVMGIVNGTETYLHRVVDAAMFRVQPVRSSAANGIVDFEPTFHVINEQA